MPEKKIEPKIWMEKNEFRYMFKWFLWGLGCLCILVVIGWIAWPMSKAVERQVLIESHQYKEGMMNRVRTWRASMAEIEQRLSTETDSAIVDGLKAQRAMLNVQLQSARRN